MPRISDPPRGNASTIAVTYRPLEPTEPNVTTWNGVRFEANIPVQLDPARHFLMAPIAEMVVVNGLECRVSRDRKVSMIELAKLNPSFEVEGFPRAQRILPPIDPATGKRKVVPMAGAEWEGTDRAELIGQMAQITDFDPAAGALVIS